MRRYASIRPLAIGHLRPSDRDTWLKRPGIRRSRSAGGSSRSRGADAPELWTSMNPRHHEGAGNAGRWPPPWPASCKKCWRQQPPVQPRHPGIPRAMVFTLMSRSCVFEICQNVRTGGSDQPPVAGSEPDRAQRPRACRGAWDRSGVFLQPEQLHGLRARTSKEGSWMMAQKDLVVAGVDVAKDKVDACTRALGSKQMFASTEEGRREFVAWLRRHKVAKVVMEASGGYEREWAKVARTAKIDVRIVDPRRVRSFAQSAGRCMARTDAL